MKKKYFITLFVVFMISTNHIYSQKNDMFKALFIYNFTKNIEWPSSYNSNDFIIGVFGNSTIIEELNKIAKRKTANDKPIIVKRINTIEQISDINILFIPINKSSHITDIVSALKSKPTLIISESPGLGEKGSCINFVQIQGDQKFEINKSSIKSHGLKVSNSLLALGIEI